MAKSKKKITRVLISIIFIAYGVSSVISAFESLLAFSLAGVLASALGVLMFITGLFGLIGASIKVCRVLGIIICVLSAANFALALSGGSFDTQMLVQALLSWIYFDCT